MRAVIPLGRGRPASLPYAVRALERYAGVTEVWTVGETPPTISPDRHIDSPNTAKPTYLNVVAHLRAALAEMDGQPFIWTADDIFPLKPWEPGVYVRKESLAGHLRRYSNRGHYTHAVRGAVALVKSWGYDPEQVPCGAIHRPWLVDPERARMVTDAIAAQGVGEWKMAYVAGVVGATPIGDPKIVGHGMPQPDADMISTEAGSWRRNAGRIIRETFREPSRWEK